MDEDTRVKTRIPVPRKGILKGHIPLRGSDLGLADSDAEGQGFSEDESSYYPAPGSHISHQPTAAQQRTGRITGRAKHTHQHPHGPSPGSIDGRRRQSESGSRRHGSASTSGTRPSQIPKLTVSWWETNSVAGEAPHDAQSESDDTSSVQSFGSHSSSVISQNWPGKSTRFVPHCQKRGHSHSHEDPGEYLTPTQRKNRVIAELRKQLRNAVKSVEEKEKHIDQLRERMAELESVLDQGGFLSENHRLLTKLKMNAEAHRREREQLAARYEARLRKLRKAMPSETDCTGPDWGAEAALIVGLEKEASNIDYDSEAHRREREQLAARYEARLRKLRKAMPSETDCTGPDWGAEAALIVGLEKEASNIDYDSGITSDDHGGSPVTVDEPTVEDPQISDPHHRTTTSTSVQTDPHTIEADLRAENGALAHDLQSAQLDCLKLQARLVELEATNSRVRELEAAMPHFVNTVGRADGRTDGCNASSLENVDQTGLIMELRAQLEAYKNECVSWRSRASEQELVARAAIERASLAEGSLISLQASYTECRTQLATHQNLDIESGECLNPRCVNLRQHLTEIEDAIDDQKLAPMTPLPTVHRLTVGRSLSGSTSPAILSPGSTLTKQVSDAGSEKRGSIGTTDAAQTEVGGDVVGSLPATAVTAAAEAQLSDIRLRLEVRSEQLDTANRELQHLRDEIGMKGTELEVAELTMERMRDSVIAANDKIKTLEESVAKLECAGVPVPTGDGVSVTPILMRKKTRFGMIQTTSRNFETTLTGAAIDSMMSELDELREKHEDLEKRYASETETLSFTLKETSTNLGVQSEVATSLSKQLGTLQQEYDDSIARWNSERDFLTSKLNELSPVAARVPYLEKELNEAIEESSQERHSARNLKEDYEKALEDALSGNLKAQATIEEYWREKLASITANLNKTKRNLDRTTQDFSSTKIILNLEKSEIQAQVEAQCEELKFLHSKIHIPTEHKDAQTDTEFSEAACQATVTCVNKGASCRPKLVPVATAIHDGDLCKFVDAGTDIHEGDLYDIKCAKISLLRGELDASRRQIQIILETLSAEKATDVKECREQSADLLSKIDDYQAEMEDLSLLRIVELNERSQLEEMVADLSAQRSANRAKERAQFAALDEEFKVLQAELADVVDRYEAEKRELSTDLVEAKDECERLEGKYSRLKRQVAKGGIGNGSKSTAGEEDPISSEDEIQRKKRVKNVDTLFEIEACEQSCFTDAVIKITSIEPTVIAVAEHNQLWGNIDVVNVCAEDDRHSPARSITYKSVENVCGMMDSGISETKSPERLLQPPKGAHVPAGKGLSIKQVTDPAAIQSERAKHIALELVKENEALRNRLQDLQAKVATAISADANLPTVPILPSVPTLFGPSLKGRRNHSCPAFEAHSTEEYLSNTGALDDPSSPETSRGMPTKDELLKLVHTPLHSQVTYPASPQAAHSQPATVRPGAIPPNVQLRQLHSELANLLDEALPQNKFTAAAITALPSPGEELSSKLLKWIADDVQQEKLELELVCQWYQRDKVQLKSLLTSVKAQYSDTAAAKVFVSEQLQEAAAELGTMKHLHREVCAELELYKREDSQRVAALREMRGEQRSETLREQGTGRQSEQKPRSKSHAIISQSDTELTKTIDEVLTKGPRSPERSAAIAAQKRAGRMLREVVSLEKRFAVAKYERSEAQAELTMLRGELEVIRADYESDRDKLLAQIEALAGAEGLSFSSEALESNVNFVRELQRNLEIKKQELFELSLRYERDLRSLQEELYAERVKKGNVDYIKELTKRLDMREAEVGELKIELLASQESLRECQKYDKTDTQFGSRRGLDTQSAASKILLRRQLETNRMEIKTLHSGLVELRNSYEARMSDLRGKLALTSAILSEKEQLLAIAEREHTRADASLEAQTRSWVEDKRLMLEAIDMLDADKRELFAALSALQNELADVPGGGARFASIKETERLWKQELNATKSRFETDLKSLRKDLISEHQRFENHRVDATARIRAMNSIITDREAHIRILERELRAAEDGITSAKERAVAKEKELIGKATELEEELVRAKRAEGERHVRFVSKSRSPSTLLTEPEPDWNALETSSCQLSNEIELAAGELNKFVETAISSRASPDPTPGPVPLLRDLDPHFLSNRLSADSAGVHKESSAEQLSLARTEDSYATALCPLPTSSPSHLEDNETASTSTQSSHRHRRTDTRPLRWRTSTESPESLTNQLTSESEDETIASSNGVGSDILNITRMKEVSPPTTASTLSRHPDDSSSSDRYGRLMKENVELERLVETLRKELSLTSTELCHTKERMDNELRRMDAENAILKEAIEISSSKLRRSRARSTECESTQTPKSMLNGSFGGTKLNTTDQGQQIIPSSGASIMTQTQALEDTQQQQKQQHNKQKLKQQQQLTNAEVQTQMPAQLLSAEACTQFAVLETFSSSKGTQSVMQISQDSFSQTIRALGRDQEIQLVPGELLAGSCHIDCQTTEIYVDPVMKSSTEFSVQTDRFGFYTGDLVTSDCQTEPETEPKPIRLVISSSSVRCQTEPPPELQHSFCQAASAVTAAATQVDKPDGSAGDAAADDEAWLPLTSSSSTSSSNSDVAHQECQTLTISKGESYCQVGTSSGLLVSTLTQYESITSLKDFGTQSEAQYLTTDASSNTDDKRGRMTNAECNTVESKMIDAACNTDDTDDKTTPEEPSDDRSGPPKDMKYTEACIQTSLDSITPPMTSSSCQTSGMIHLNADPPGLSTSCQATTETADSAAQTFHPKLASPTFKLDVFSVKLKEVRGVSVSSATERRQLRSRKYSMDSVLDPAGEARVTQSSSDVDFGPICAAQPVSNAVATQTDEVVDRPAVFVNNSRPNVSKQPVASEPKDDFSSASLEDLLSNLGISETEPGGVAALSSFAPTRATVDLGVQAELISTPGDDAKRNALERQRSEELESALVTNRILETRVEQMAAEAELNEEKHKEMYMVMFKKGRDVARAELQSATSATDLFDSRSMDYSALPSFQSLSEVAESTSSIIYQETSTKDRSSFRDTKDRSSFREISLEWDARSGREGSVSSEGAHDVQLFKEWDAKSGREGSVSSEGPHDVQLFKAQVHQHIAKYKDGSGEGPGPSGGLSAEEILLRFLRDAVYYFLVNRDPKDHLHAIMSILNFSDRQRADVLKLKSYGRHS